MHLFQRPRDPQHNLSFPLAYLDANCKMPTSERNGRAKEKLASRSALSGCSHGDYGTEARPSRMETSVRSFHDFGICQYLGRQMALLGEDVKEGKENERGEHLTAGFRFFERCRASSFWPPAS